jgi:uncharacterized cupin superfamily protein
MADYTRVNLKSDVKDMAPEHGMEGIESRFARTNLELANSGLSYFGLGPGYRAPFGHTHKEQEEIYVVLSGSGRPEHREQGRRHGIRLVAGRLLGPFICPRSRARRPRDPGRA